MARLLKKPSPRLHARISSGILVASLTISYGVGIWIGAALFSHVQPRSFLSLHHCEQTCLRPSEIAGLVAAVGIQSVEGHLPLVVAETEKSIAISHPVPEDDFHFVIFPKKDIRNIGELTNEDSDYLTDAYALMQELIRSQKLTTYKIVTNGPGYQKVGYLHFHLLGER